MEIRKEKLPDPKVMPSAGYFQKWNSKKNGKLESLKDINRIYQLMTWEMAHIRYRPVG